MCAYLCEGDKSLPANSGLFRPNATHVMLRVIMNLPAEPVSWLGGDGTSTSSGQVPGQGTRFRQAGCVRDRSGPGCGGPFPKAARESLRGTADRTSSPARRYPVAHSRGTARSRPCSARAVTSRHAWRFLLPQRRGSCCRTGSSPAPALQGCRLHRVGHPRAAGDRELPARPGLSQGSPPRGQLRRAGTLSWKLRLSRTAD